MGILLHKCILFIKEKKGKKKEKRPYNERENHSTWKRKGRYEDKGDLKRNWVQQGKLKARL